MQLNMVVLPAPFGPTRPTASPAATASDTSFSAAIPPKRMEIERASKRGGDPAPASAPNTGAGAAPSAVGSATESLPRRHTHRRHHGHGAAQGARSVPERRTRIARLALVVMTEQLAHTRQPHALLVLDDA